MKRWRVGGAQQLGRRRKILLSVLNKIIIITTSVGIRIIILREDSGLESGSESKVIPSLAPAGRDP